MTEHQHEHPDLYCPKCVEFGKGSVDPARMVLDTQKAVTEHLVHIQRLRDDIRVLEEVLPVKRAALEHAEAEHVKYADLLREVFEFYRSDVQKVTP